MAQLIDCIAMNGTPPYWVLIDDLGDSFDVIMPNGLRERRRKVAAASIVEIPVDQLSNEQRAVMAQLDREVDRTVERRGDMAEFFREAAVTILSDLKRVRDAVDNPRQYYGETPDDAFLETIVREQLLTFDQMKASHHLPLVTDFWFELLSTELHKTHKGWVRKV